MTTYFKNGRWQMMVTPPEMVADKQAAEIKKKAGKELPEELKALKARMDGENGSVDESTKDVWEEL